MNRQSGLSCKTDGASPVKRDYTPVAFSRMPRKRDERKSNCCFFFLPSMPGKRKFESGTRRKDTGRIQMQHFFDVDIADSASGHRENYVFWLATQGRHVNILLYSPHAESITHRNLGCLLTTHRQIIQSLLGCVTWRYVLYVIFTVQSIDQLNHLFLCGMCVLEILHAIK